MNTHTGGLLGIKTSDGAIVEVLAFGTADDRTTVFTTVADRQRRARFEFYFRAAGNARWIYLDALSLERIRPAEAGEPDLEVHARCDGQGNLRLGMQGPSSAPPQVFVVEAKTLDRFRTLAGAAAPAAQPAAAARRPSTRPPLQEPKQGRGPKAAWFVLVPILLGGALALYFFGSHGGPGRAAQGGSERHSPGEANAPLRAASKPEPGHGTVTPGTGSRTGRNTGADRAEEPDRTSTGSGSIPAAEAGQQPAEAGWSPTAAPEHPEATPEAPVQSFGGQESYQIIWGDTLWRITERYYGDRDLYPELAESNELLDPDFIIAGESLRLPPAIGDRKRKSREGEGYEWEKKEY